MTSGKVAPESFGLQFRALSRWDLSCRPQTLQEHPAGSENLRSHNRACQFVGGDSRKYGKVGSPGAQCKHGQSRSPPRQRGIGQPATHFKLYNAKRLSTNGCVVILRLCPSTTSQLHSCRHVSIWQPHGMMAWDQELVLASACTVHRLTAEDSAKSSRLEQHEQTHNAVYPLMMEQTVLAKDVPPRAALSSAMRPDSPLQGRCAIARLLACVPRLPEMHVLRETAI